MWRAAIAVMAVGLGCLGGGPVEGEEPVALRVESLLVSPSHGPLARVDVENRLSVEYRGTLRLAAPAGWRIVPERREVRIAPGRVERVAFNVERGEYAESNGYAVEVVAEGAGVTVRRRQSIQCATAPYFKPAIDGRLDDWKDAIPASFVVQGKRTTISTYWNRSQFSILVGVEEDRLVGYRADGGPFDAVQLSLASAGSTTGTRPDQPAGRYEFLLVWTGTGTTGKCFQLARPDTKLAETGVLRKLGGLECDKAQVSVSRQGRVTYYECGLPMKPMRAEIPPSEGREFCLSILIHDPDGTGLRDWGEAVGLWPWQRNRMAWSMWPGAAWGREPPYDSRVEWGMCASKY
jgi:hypothetical protein